MEHEKSLLIDNVAHCSVRGCCRLNLELCWINLELCWINLELYRLNLELCWLNLELCWLNLELCWLHVELCWLAQPGAVMAPLGPAKGHRRLWMKVSSPNQMNVCWE
jgi:hypothetical protein